MALLSIICLEQIFKKQDLFGAYNIFTYIHLLVTIPGTSSENLKGLNNQQHTVKALKYVNMEYVICLWFDT